MVLLEISMLRVSNIKYFILWMTPLIFLEQQPQEPANSALGIFLVQWVLGELAEAHIHILSLV